MLKEEKSIDELGFQIIQSNELQCKQAEKSRRQMGDQALNDGIRLEWNKIYN